MAFAHRIAPSHRLAAIRFYGTVTGTDILEGIRSLYSDPAWEPGFQMIWDARDVAQLILDPADADAVVEVSKTHQDLSRQSRTAVLSGGFFVYTSAMMFHVRANRGTEREMEIFETLPEALAWLGLDELPPTLAAFLTP